MHQVCHLLSITPYRNNFYFTKQENIGWVSSDTVAAAAPLTGNEEETQGSVVSVPPATARLRSVDRVTTYDPISRLREPRFKRELPELVRKTATGLELHIELSRPRE